MNSKMTPIEQVGRAFRKPRPALMPYFTLGYPNLPQSLEIIRACAEAGADLMELGIPFSDPLADGPTIQHSSQIALDGGMTVGSCLEGVRALRRAGVKLPFMLMGYYNPILSYSVDRFVQEAAESGAHGFIIPDLPPEEASQLVDLCQEHALALSFLVAPNSTEARIRLVSQKSSGFTYLVSVTGITGARNELPAELGEFVARVRRLVHTPVAVGFGISTPHQAHAVGEIADGVIVGSALIKAVDEASSANGDLPEAAAGFIRALRTGIDESNNVGSEAGQ